MFGSRTHAHSSYEAVASKTFTWKSSDQNFYCYDKDTQERIPLAKDAKLIPLTSTNSVTGVRERDHGKATQRYNSIYSNEFTDYKKDIVSVKEFDRLDNTKTVIAEGVYSPTVKDIIADLPFAKFTKNIYCLLDGEVVKLSLSGSSLKPWIDFENELKKTNEYITNCHFVTLGESTEVVNGAVHFFSPAFKLGNITAEENEKANQIAFEVEDKLARNRGGNDEPATFDAPIAQAPAQVAAPNTVENNETIDLSEIPF